MLGRIKNFVRKGVEDMAIIYAQLIIKGKRTFESVPALVKPQVKEILTDMERPELAAEEMATKNHTEGKPFCVVTAERR